MTALLALTTCASALRAQRIVPAQRPEMIRFCNLVDKKVEMEGRKPFTYEYEMALWTMAGAVPPALATDPATTAKADTQAEARTKIQKLWNAHHAEMWCEIEGYGIGNPLKLAVENHFLKMLLDAIRRYGMDPNKVDRTDGCTVLDHTEYKIADAKKANRDAAFIEELEVIRRILLELGAKHVHEVEGYSDYPKTNPCFATR